MSSSDHALPPLEDLLPLLAIALQGPLPGSRSQLAMAPEMRPNVAIGDDKAVSCREAGVLLLLFPLHGQIRLLLTERPMHLPHHPGQIAFPGGRREEGETVIETALREANEEVGLDVRSVEVLGALTPLYVPPSNFCVYPFIGACHTEPRLAPRQGEVESILPVSIEALLEPAACAVERWDYRGAKVRVPCYLLDGHRIWGATAMILAEFLTLLRAVLPRPHH